MSKRLVVTAWALVFVAGCPRASEKRDGAVATSPSNANTNANASVDGSAVSHDASIDVTPAPVITTREIGPFEVPFETREKWRTVYYVIPPTVSTPPAPRRLLANLHGVCNPPGYACGYWVQAGSKAGFLICPTGNSRCGGMTGPPTWTESFPQMDADLEKAIEIVDAKHPGEITRDNAILTGFSMGAFAAYQIAKTHPGRWPYLILNESDVQLDKAQLEKAGVRAVALIAGEIGSQVAGERKTAERLKKQGYPARLWLMKGAGHHYSADIDAIMEEAIAFVLSEGIDAGQ